MVTVYALEGSSGKRYVGITNDLARRINEHAAGKTKASQVLGEFRVLHTEEFGDYEHARIREKFLKSGKGRAWLIEHFGKSRPA